MEPILSLLGACPLVAKSRVKDEHNPRDNLPLAQRINVLYDREDMAILADLVDTINDYSLAGGWFRSHGDAIETALGRLRNEEDFIRRRCTEEDVPYIHAAFLSLYDSDRTSIPNVSPGPSKPGETKQRPPRVLVRAHMAIEMRDYGKRSWVVPGYLPRLSQVAELGLLRLFRGDGFRVDADQQEPRLTVQPDAFWKDYQRAARMPR